MAAPRYQRRGVDRSLAIEKFNRVFASDLTRPRLWPLVHDEREALEALDIPRFTIPAASTELTSSTGEIVRGFYARSGVDAMRTRLSALGEADLVRQVDQLRTALGDYDAAAAAPAHGADEHLRAAAECIGRLLLARAQEGPGGSLRWPSSGGRVDLYSGAAGIGLFFAGLAAYAGGAWRDAAERVWRAVDVDMAADSAPVRTRMGICSGLPSVAYAMAVAGVLLDDPDRVRGALALAAGIPEEAIDDDAVLDIEGGVAGTLMALVAVHEIHPDDRLVARARRCVARLAGTQITSGSDRGAWPAADDGCARAGFAHGAAGIAAALCRYGSHVNEPDVREVVEKAWGFERRLFAGNAGTWPTVRRDGGRILMAAWCHGAPGIALARAGVPAAMSDPLLRDEIEAAMAQTLAAPASQLDHLCCGNLGRADVALTVGRLTGVSAWSEAGAALIGTAAARVLAQGRRGMRGRGHQQGAPDPELFQGVAGIGYQCLRTAPGSRLPSVLAFEAPPWPGGGSHTAEQS